MQEHDQELMPVESPVSSSNSTTLTDFVIQNLHNIKNTDVRNINVKVDPKTGKEQLEVNLNNGTTLVQTNHSSGITERSVISTPTYNSIQERNEAVRQLYQEGKTQEEIARIFNVSQTTIHNALK